MWKFILKHFIIYKSSQAVVDRIPPRPMNINILVQERNISKEELLNEMQKIKRELDRQ